MKNIWKAEVEDAKDPYGEGPGYILLVHARTSKGARRKANQHAQKKWPGYKTYKVHRAPSAVI